MAFMTVPASAGAGVADRVPVLAYDARSGRLSLHDRMQDDDGKWATVKTDVTRSEPAFAVDFGRLEVGYVHFADARAPLWAMAFYGEPAVQEPPATAEGKRFKAGFRVPVISKAIGGLREFAGNSAALIGGMNELHTVYEEAPEARAGKLPLVKIIDTREIRSGQACNYQPIFEILSWVNRPTLLGPRKVPPPGAVNGHAQPARTASATRHGNREIEDVHAQRLASSRAPVASYGAADRWADDGAWNEPVRQAGGGRAVARTRFAPQVA